MLVLISGGSGSGKSQLAEKLAVRLADNSALYYVATMMRGHDAESARKIARHRDPGRTWLFNRRAAFCRWRISIFENFGPGDCRIRIKKLSTIRRSYTS